MSSIFTDRNWTLIRALQSSKLYYLARNLKRVVKQLHRPGSATPTTAASGPRLCDLNGINMMLDLSAPAHEQIYYNKGFEREVTETLRQLVCPGEVFVDIGANVGW